MKSLNDLYRGGVEKRKQQVASALVDSKIQMRIFEQNMEFQRKRYIRNAIEAKKTGDTEAVKLAYSGIRITTAQLRAVQRMRINTERLEAQNRLNEMVAGYAQNISEVSSLMTSAAGGQINYARMQREYNKAMKPLAGICDGLEMMGGMGGTEDLGDLGVSDSELDQLISQFEGKKEPVKAKAVAAPASTGEDGDINAMLKSLTDMLNS